MRQSIAGAAGNGSDLMLQPGNGWFIRRPSAEGETLFRMIPHLNEDGTEQSQIVAPELAVSDPKAALSDALTEYECMRFAGSKNYQFISEPVDAISNCATPAMLMWRALRDYRKSHRKECPDDWYNWFERGVNNKVYEAFSKPKASLFIKGVLIKYKGEVLKDKTDHPMVLFPTVLQIHQYSAYSELINGLTTPIDRNAPLSSTNCLLGDVVSCENGRMISIMPESRQNPTTRKMQTYYPVRASDPYPVSLDLVRSVHKEWAAILNLLPASRIIELLADTFSAAAVCFALTDTPYGRHIPTEVAKAGMPRTPAVSPQQISTFVPSTVPAPVSAPVLAGSVAPAVTEPTPATGIAPAPAPINTERPSIPYPQPTISTPDIEVDDVDYDDADEAPAPTPSANPANPMKNITVPPLSAYSAPKVSSAATPSVEEMRRKLAEAQARLTQKR